MGLSYAENEYTKIYPMFYQMQENNSECIVLK